MTDREKRFLEQLRAFGCDTLPLTMDLEAPRKGHKRAKRIRLMTATRDHLRQIYRLVNFWHHRSEEVQNLIEMMKVYNRAFPGITLAEALNLWSMRRRRIPRAMPSTDPQRTDEPKL